MPEFDLDAALAAPPSEVFASYHYAAAAHETYQCTLMTGVPEAQFLCGMICDVTGLVIVQLLSGRYFTRYGDYSARTERLEDAIEWLRHEYLDDDNLGVPDA